MISGLSKKAKEAMKHIQREVLRCGESPSVRELMHLLGYRSPNSAALILKELCEAGYLQKRPDGNYLPLKDVNSPQGAYTILIPLVGNAACGSPIYAEENVEAMIPVATKLLRPHKKYFFVRAQGDSMNKAGIDNGSLVLIEQRSVAENGQKVLALIDDEVTIKFYFKQKKIAILKPSSTNDKHQPIVLGRDFQVQGIVSMVLKNI